MNFKPLNDLVLVKKLEETNVTKGGIHLPVTANIPTCKAEVVAVTDGYNHPNSGIWIYPNVSVGNIVTIAKGVGMELEVDGEKYFLLKENTLLGVDKKVVDKGEEVV